MYIYFLEFQIENMCSFIYNETMLKKKKIRFYIKIYLDFFISPRGKARKQTIYATFSYSVCCAST